MGNQGPHQMDIARWGLGLDRLADRVIAYGGRLGYEDAGDVANTEVALFEFGDKTLVFEVRGLETDPLRGAKVGVIFYGSEGYVVLTSYTTGAAFDPQGKLVKKFKGGGDHFGNFVDAVKARDPKRLHAEVLEGHLSCARTATWPISPITSASRPRSTRSSTRWPIGRPTRTSAKRCSGRSSTWRPTRST